MRNITLTTDFGLNDGFTGAVKGVIKTINPQAHITDITHLIPQYDVNSAMFVIYSTCFVKITRLLQLFSQILGQLATDLR